MGITLMTFVNIETMRGTGVDTSGSMGFLYHSPQWDQTCTPLYIRTVGQYLPRNVRTASGSAHWSHGKLALLWRTSASPMASICFTVNTFRQGTPWTPSSERYGCCLPGVFSHSSRVTVTHTTSLARPVSSFRSTGSALTQSGHHFTSLLSAAVKCTITCPFSLSPAASCKFFLSSLMSVAHS